MSADTPEDWKSCRVGSCHRHEQCMYEPCRNYSPYTPDAAALRARVAELEDTARALLSCWDELPLKFTDQITHATNRRIKDVRAALSAAPAARSDDAPTLEEWKATRDNDAWWVAKLSMYLARGVSLAEALDEMQMLTETPSPAAANLGDAEGGA